MGFAEDVMQALKDAAQEAGSVNALAVKSGLRQATLQRWLAGSRDPSLSGLAIIMDYLDMTVCRRDPNRPRDQKAKPGSVAEAILESQRLASALEASERRNAKLEGQVEILKEMLGAPPAREKNAG